MRKLWLLFWLLPIGTFAQTVGYPTIPIVQSNNNNLNAASITCAFPSSVTSGSEGFIVAIWESSTNTPTIADTLLSSYGSAKLLSTANLVKMAVFATTFGSSGANTVTFSVVGGPCMMKSCVEMPPNWTLTVDTSSVTTYSGSPSTITAPNVTSNFNNDLIFTIFGDDANTAQYWLTSANLGNAWSVTDRDGSCTQGLYVSIAGAKGTVTGQTVSGGTSQGTVATLAFQPNALAINSPSVLPDGALSTAYKYTLLATGGVSTYTWSITSGSLQSGLSLNSSTGAITGTPTTSTNNSITFQVTDGTTTVTKAVTLKVGATMGTIALIQGVASTVGTGSNPLAFTSNVGSGNLLVVQYGYNNSLRNFFKCTDTLGTVFSPVANYHSLAGDFGQGSQMMIMAGVAPSSGADTVNCVGTNIIDQLSEFSNINFIASDTTAGTNGTTTPPATVTSNSLSTLVPNQLLALACTVTTGSGVTISPVAPFVQVATPPAAYTSNLGYDVASTVTSYTPQCSYTNASSGRWIIGVAGFRPSAGAISPPSKLIYFPQFK